MITKTTHTRVYATGTLIQGTQHTLSKSMNNHCSAHPH